MSLSILGGNQTRAARIAREIVRDLAPTDIEFTVTEAMGLEGEQRLCTAVDDDFLAQERRINELDDQLRKLCSDEVWELLSEKDDLVISSSSIRQTASFNLGFAAALRLLSKQPRLTRVNGGNCEPRLKGNCGL